MIVNVINQKDLAFGQTIVRGRYASMDNPQREGVFVEMITRRGRMNPGTWIRCTDGKGSFWEYPLDSVEIEQPESTIPRRTVAEALAGLRAEVSSMVVNLPADYWMKKIDAIIAAKECRPVGASDDPLARQ